jgi:raffinose/stachyose/melibiose transport system substrate-binding protein
MLKKSVTLPVAALALTLGLAGCSTDGPDQPAEGGDTTLTLSGWSGDETMEAIIAQFEADNPGVTVEFTGLPWPTILTQINTELVSGTASDVVVVFPGNGNPITAQTLAKGDYLVDLSDRPWVSQFNDANQTVMGADGKVLMVANNFTIIPATYNTQALEAVGAKAPSTWSEVLDLCSAAQAKGKVAYAMAGLAGGTYNYLPFALSATLVDGPNPDFAAQQAAGDVTFSASEWTTTLGKYVEMLDAGCFTKDALGTSLEIAQEQVAKGDAVGIVTVSNQLADVERLAPEGSSFETAALPATDDPSQTVLPVGLGAGYGINAKGNVERRAPGLADGGIDLPQHPRRGIRADGHAVRRLGAGARRQDGRLPGPDLAELERVSGLPGRASEAAGRKHDRRGRTRRHGRGLRRVEPSCQ